MLFVYILHLALVAGVPAEVSEQMYSSSLEYGLDPYDVAAVLISEHSSYDADFSVVSSLLRGAPYNWDPNTEGSGGELGLFQTKKRWAWKAGFDSADRADPIIGTMIGVYVIAQAQTSHADCRDHNHSWIAHWKGGDRDSPSGQSRFAQSKWEIVRLSLGRLFPVNVRELHHKHFRRARDWYDG